MFLVNKFYDQHPNIDASANKQLAKQVLEEFDKKYMLELVDFLEIEINKSLEIFPPKDQWFNALNSTPPLEKIQVVILGQDPYPTPGHAHGLCFSVLPDVFPIPKSLKNIYKELEADLDVKNEHGNLQSWADQGVLNLGIYVIRCLYYF